MSGLRPGRSRQLGNAYLLVLAALCLWSLRPFVAWVAGVVPFPYGIDYGEGIVWKQMIDMVAGTAYGPVDRFPAIVYHYPPVYHLLSAGVAALGVDQLAAGRIVSVAGTVISAAFIAAITARATGSRLSPTAVCVGAGFAAAIFLGFSLVRFWTPLMRVDMAACAFAMAGIWFALEALRRPKLIYLAAFSFALSIYTKQIAVIAPAAAFGVLLLTRPRLALRGIAACALIGVVVLVALSWMTDGGVLRHLFLYNVNRFSLARLLPGIADATTRADLLPVIVAGVTLLAVGWGLLRRVRSGALGFGRRSTDRDILTLIPLAFLILKTLSLVAIAKSGSSTAYWVEWVAGLAVFAGWGMAWCIDAGRDRGRGKAAASAALAAPLGMALWLAIMPDREPKIDLAVVRQINLEIESIIVPITKPIISDDMVLLLRNGKAVVWEPAIFAELAHSPHYDERPMAAMIRRGDIGMVLSWGIRGEEMYDSRFNPLIADSIDARLPIKRSVANWVIHLPR